uniref:RH1 domain-containing protein n=1 Tax=Meloidogyne floridensis TaxID=298350 RepID=A0A915NVF6_9BILA
MQSSTSSNELIYGGASSAYGSEEASHVMSDKVQAIASAVYKEFESMIQKFGQESVKDLMPLVVNVLENLDSAFLEKDELAVDNEMLKEENEQLLNQYERERQMRKSQDQKYLEVEESLLEQNRELENKVGSMASIVRMLELKTKNACDHASRLEEREADQKMEYDKLHERYNELLRTHIDHVERTKFLMGTEMFDMANSLPVASKNNKSVFLISVIRNSMAMSAIDSNVRGISDIISAVHMSQSTHADLNLASHINSNERDWHEEFGGLQTAAEILATPREEKPANSPLPSVVESPKEVVTLEDVDEEEEDDEQKVPERFLI